MMRISHAFVYMITFALLATGMCFDKESIRYPFGYKYQKKVQFNEPSTRKNIRIRQFSEIDKETGHKNSREIVSESLDITSKYLEFRGKPKKYFVFEDRVKNTDCIDYSYLFKATFDKKKEKHGLDECSCDVVYGVFYMMGQKKGNHYWILVKDHGKNLWIDPVLHDFTGKEYVNELMLN